MVNLTELYLAENQIEKVEGLDSIKGLVILDLSFNKIPNLKDLPQFE